MVSEPETRWLAIGVVIATLLAAAEASALGASSATMPAFSAHSR
jgi:hypothetical protein